MRGILNTGVLPVVLCAFLVLHLEGSRAFSPYHKHNEREEAWTHNVLLDGGKDFRAKWVNFEDSEGDLWIEVEVSAKTKGYIGVGFSPKGGMIDADMGIGWVNEKGEAFIQDFYGLENGMPYLDAEQNYHLVSGHERNGYTTIRFMRKWDTCDERDMVLGADTTRLIWAIGGSDPRIQKDGTVTGLGYHGMSRGTKSVYLSEEGKTYTFPSEKDKDISYWDMRMPNVEVKQPNTTYHCRVVKFSDTKKKQHMIGWKPLIAPENSKNVHHITFYECNIPEELVQEFDFYAKHHEGSYCFTKNMPYLWGEMCSGNLLVWTVGSEGEMLPDHVGAVLGQEHGGATYFMIEMHYENPEGREIVDNSGIRIYYTDKLRQYDGSLIGLGYKHSPFLLVPPKQQNFMQYALCGKDCLGASLPEEGVNVISTLVHAHLYGKKIKLRHIRNGVELPALAEDNHYDFNYQQSKMLKHEVKLLPGDELITECEYNTEGMNEFVLGGLSTYQEMCLVMVFYYPKVQMQSCSSQNHFDDLMFGLGIEGNVTGEILPKLGIPFDPTASSYPADVSKALEEMDDGSSVKRNIFDEMWVQRDGKTVRERMDSLNWDDPKVGKNVQEAWKSGRHYQYCSAERGRKIQMKNDYVTYPEISKPLQISKGKECAKLKSYTSASQKVWKGIEYNNLMLASMGSVFMLKKLFSL